MLEFRPMRWSRLFIPTLRENPADAETVSQQLLVRAGYVRAVKTGVYGYLPLGQRALGKIQRIAREEIEALGGQEVGLDPAEAAEIGRGEIRGTKSLPQLWFRVESPLLRRRQFAGVDVYGFGEDGAAIRAAFRKIFKRCEVPALEAEDAFVVLTDAGTDTAVVCGGCGYTASQRTAWSVPAPVTGDPADDSSGGLTPEEFHTPGQKTIADIAAFTGLPDSAQMKSLVLVANQKPVLVMLRGDHQLNEARFAAKTGDATFRQATAEELFKWFGAQAGSLGPVGVKNMPILADIALKGRRNMISGANKTDYHLRNVTPGEDFDAEFCDLREVAAGDTCVRCGAALEFRNAVELARMSAGSYRLSAERILTTAVELGNDKDGMALPGGIAPFDVVVSVAVTTDAAQSAAAERIYEECLAAGLDALIDDRDERPGVKFKDADLIGVPWRVTVGKKIAGGVVEVVERKTKVITDTALAEAASTIEVWRAGKNPPGHQG
ncbi:MAG: Anticodon-binding domain protein [Candidatus Solibacter sp.]|nr:Anticodon-binding domain protein [Candidatus Solibacter sp.]